MRVGGYQLLHLQESALARDVGAMRLRLKPPEWLAVKTGVCAPRRSSRSLQLQGDQAALVLCVHLTMMHADSSRAPVSHNSQAGLVMCCMTMPYSTWHPVHAQALRGLLPEVVAYDEFMGRTGIRGGWHPQVPTHCTRQLTYPHARCPTLAGARCLRVDMLVSTSQ